MHMQDELIQKNKTKYFDLLTGLPNRQYLYDFFSKNINDFIVIFLDIDNFKYIKDTHSHKLGDEFLAKISNRLLELIHGDGIIFTCSADEFVILLRKNDLKIIDKKINLILREMQGAFKVKEYEVNTSASMGIYITSGNDTIDDAIRRANIAMYEAKRCGKAQYVYFEEYMEKEIKRKAMISGQLRKSIAKRELTLFYQPIFDIKEKRIVEIEALLRWENEKLGKVSPGEFIPIAEEIGFIGELGLWVIREVCNQIKEWNDIGIDINVAINISPNQFKEKGFFEKLKSLIQSYKIDFTKIKFEITETQILKSEKENIEKLRELISLGPSISLDDFGTGYSSMKNMAFFPISEIKIDKSFIDYINIDKRMANLISSIILTAQRLGYTVTAEGVESKEQFNKLLECGCNKIQGYYIGRPMGKKDIIQFIQN